MKKLFCLLLCLCLLSNGWLTLAEEDYSEPEEAYTEAAEEASEPDEGEEEKEKGAPSDSREEPEEEEEVPNIPDTQEEEEQEEDGEQTNAPSEEEEEMEQSETEDEARPEAEDEAQPEAEGPEDELPDGAEEEAPEDAGIPEDAQAWLNIDGAPFGGSLSGIIDLLEGGETVYLLTSRVVHVRDVPLYIIGDVTFRPDSDRFGSGYEVRLYNADPDEGGAVMDLSDAPGWELADIWFHVEDKDSEPSGTDPEEPEEPETCTISVSPSAFEEEEWINRAPTFTLTGIPEDRDWIYAVIIYDDRIIPLSGDTYRPRDDGIYTLQFAIQDYLGDMIAVSNKLTPWFDWTKPKVTIEASKNEDYTLNITATDALSGVASLSLDGGRTWIDALDGATYTYSASTKATLPAGQIQVMDYAGNIYSSEKSYELAAVKTATATKAPSSSSGSSDSSSSGTSTHASDSEDDEVEDDALNLVVPDKSMQQLVVDGQVMALTLTLETEDGARPISFTGRFEPWYNTEGRMTYTPNLLVLDANLEDVGDVFNCHWHINGEVFRVLNNAGVDYIAFQALDDMCVAAAAGFIGGTKFIDLKQQGISTKQFDYTLTMKVNRDAGLMTALSDNDMAEDCDFALRVDVDGMGYELNGSPKNPIYYYDIYLGGEDMLSVPFGEYEG